MRPHDGSGMPADLHPDALVTVTERGGWCETHKAKSFGWTHRLDASGKPWAGDIVAYELAERAKAEGQS